MRWEEARVQVQATEAERELVGRAIDDVGLFSRALLGVELWPYQLELARSPARYRVVAKGRQVGGSHLLAVLALHAAWRKPHQMVLIVASGEVASRRLLEVISTMATSSAMFRGSVLDDSKSELRLGNGSRILAVPASHRQIRGWAVDLLLVDEAGFIDQEIWQAAEPAIIARPGSRVVLASSPWGGASHFFRLLWERGTRSPDEQVASWHWPTTMSPNVSDEDLEEIRKRNSPLYFAREYLAEWTADVSSFFTQAEIDNAVADYELVTPGRKGENWRRLGEVVGGLDFGQAVDSHALVTVGVLADGGRNQRELGPEPVFWIPHLEVHERMPYHRFTDLVLDACDPTREGLRARWLVAERNGVGAPVAESLKMRAWERRMPTTVVPAWTDNRRKESGYGAIRLLLQQGRLVLPRHVELLKQLAGLQLEITPTGATRIHVPEAGGAHDDIVDALMQSMSALRTSIGSYWERPDEPDQHAGEELRTGAGAVIHERPATSMSPRWAFRPPAGAERTEGW